MDTLEIYNMWGFRMSCFELWEKPVKAFESPATYHFCSGVEEKIPSVLNIQCFPWLSQLVIGKSIVGVINNKSNSNSINDSNSNDNNCYYHYYYCCHNCRSYLGYSVSWCWSRRGYLVRKRVGSVCSLLLVSEDQWRANIFCFSFSLSFFL